MARWLQGHPQILFPFVKEPHFFGQHDLRGLDDDGTESVSSTIISIISSAQPEPGQRSAPTARSPTSTRPSSSSPR